MNCEDYDLFWHALNYRCAGVLGSDGSEAEEMWKELVACVNRLIERGEPWSEEE
jgi:hypothetical protein